MVDLRHLRLEFTALLNDKASQLRAQQELTRRENERLQSLLAKKQLQGGTTEWSRQAHEGLKDEQFAVSFDMKSILVFRDHYTDNELRDVVD